MIKSFLKDLESHFKSHLHRLTTQRFERSLKWRSGPRSLALHPEEVVVVCLIRDGSRYLAEFLRHHRDMGIERFVFLDNDSKDGTPDLLAGQPGVSVFHSKMPYRSCKIAAKQFLTQNFGRSNWVLLLDIDEFFQFPFCEGMTLKNFVRYLNRNDYSAVVTQMLDMFPSGPIDALNKAPGNNCANLLHCSVQNSFLNEHRYFSLAGLHPVAYADSICNRSANLVDCDTLTAMFGGIRYRKFETNVFLTKHPLIFPAKGAKLQNCHLVKHARLANLSGVLLHYKFTEGFREYVAEIVAEGSFHKGSAEYKSYKRILSENREFTFCDETSRTYSSTNQLIDHGFITVSDRFREYSRNLVESEFKLSETQVGRSAA